MAGQLAERWGIDRRGQRTAVRAALRRAASDDRRAACAVSGSAGIHRTSAAETVHSMEHRAGWDATFSAPKSVSLTALVGGDERVREAHRQSVRSRLMRWSGTCRRGSVATSRPQTTGTWAVAKFEHDSSRPVEGYAAPQLHTHAVVFNVTETADGNTRALQPQELYKTQQYATAVYRSELAARLQGWVMRSSVESMASRRSRAIQQEYLEASSPRRQQIKEAAGGAGPDGRGSRADRGTSDARREAAALAR